MAIPNQKDFLAHAGNADVAKYVAGGGDFNQWWNTHGKNENRQWQTPATPTMTVSEPPKLNTASTGGGSVKPVDQKAFLAHSGNADVAKYVAGGGNFDDWWKNHGQHENRQWQASGSYDRNPADYASRYHEIRGIGLDFDALGIDVPDYTTTAVSSAPFKNAYHYTDPITGQVNADLLRKEIQSGAFRFNPDYYAAQNPDLAAAGITSGTDLMNHFINYGFKEGRAPGIEAPVYVNPTQTDAQAAAGYDPIAAKLLAMGETPNWGTSGFGFGTAEGHGQEEEEEETEAERLMSEIGEILSRGNFNDNVQDNIADVIAADSPLMKLAETRARQVANSRGLLNSSMAVNAGQDAVLNVAMPIGSQQAGQNFQANENARGFGYQSALLGQELDWRGDQAYLDRLQQITLQNNDIGFRSAEASLDRALQERLQTWNLNATEADNAARQMYGAQSLLQNTLVNINANTNLNAEQRTAQITQARADFDMMMALIEQIYQVNLSWAA